LRITDHVPGDEEIGGEAHLVDDTKLFIQLVPGGPVDTIPLPAAVAGEFLEECPVVLTARAIELFVLVFAEVHGDRAGVEQAVSVGDDKGMLSEGGEYLHLGDKIFFVSGDILRLQFGQQGVFVDGPKQAVEVIVGLVLPGHGLADDPFVRVGRQGLFQEFVDLVRQHADAFVLQQGFRCFSA
jgi:hypothetical protein